jgi:hypothetical protein
VPKWSHEVFILWLAYFPQHSVLKVHLCCNMSEFPDFLRLNNTPSYISFCLPIHPSINTSPFWLAQIVLWMWVDRYLMKTLNFSQDVVGVFLLTVPSGFWVGGGLVPHNINTMRSQISVWFHYNIAKHRNVALTRVSFRGHPWSFVNYTKWGAHKYFLTIHSSPLHLNPCHQPLLPEPLQQPPLVSPLHSISNPFSSQQAENIWKSMHLSHF